jgi:UDP-N-acetylmuramoyl-L-alanyl-D-glutamate--2,6-diaminopimelate ligase
VAQAAALAGPAEVIGEPEALVTGTTHDSRAVRPGDLYCCVPGARSDGHDHAPAAVAAGAAALLCERPLGLGVPEVLVPSVRMAMAPVAARLHGDPSRHLSVVGITGTNGKTTTSWLVQRALEELGVRCARLGTLGFELAGQTDETHLTTPEADGISRALALTRRRGGTHAVMEVSSVALATSRVEALAFEVAAFSNLTHDHLDFHGTFEAYRAAKARLFRDLRPGSAVLNVDDEFGRWLADNTEARVVRVGMGEGCEVSGGGLRALPTGVAGSLVVRGQAVELSTRFVGRHNAENLMLALGILGSLGVEPALAARAIGRVEPVPGRLERCDGPGDDCVVLVDYAHTPDALERVLSALSPASGRTLCVFGCGGDRDPKKRAPMGRAAGEGASYSILTNDNPRGEAPDAIAAAVEQGLRAAGASYEVCLDRERAIERAVSMAAPGDVVLIAGKGHETYQLIGGLTLPFDDRREARLALERRRARRSETAG